MAENVEWGTEIEFVLNGEKVTIDKPSTTITLGAYIRNNTRFTGTKISCAEGGCGACVVVVGHPQPGSDSDELVWCSVNACLRPLVLCDGMEILTTEGIGNKRKGYHEVQKVLAEGYGSQCGFCSPGMVMSMYGLLLDQPDGAAPTAQAIESLFDGNICRCTGYRPILQAFRQFSSGDGNNSCNSQNTSNQKGGLCKGREALQHKPLRVEDSNGTVWYKPNSLEQLMDVLEGCKDESIRFVCGNTASGVFRSLSIDQPENVVVTTSFVPELLQYSADSSGVYFGSAVTLKTISEFLHQQISSLDETKTRGFVCIAEMLTRIAHTHVRNVGSWAGNVMMARQHGFGSDLVTVLSACDAQIHATDYSTNSPATFSVYDFVTNTDGSNTWLITQLVIPYTQPDEWVYASKVALRHFHAHSLLNFAVKAQFSVDTSSPKKVTLGNSIIIFGVVSNSGKPIRAKNTENYLNKKQVGMEALEGASAAAIEEIGLEALTQYCSQEQPDGKFEYRSSQVTMFLYTFFLSTLYAFSPSSLPASVLSAAKTYQRPLSTAIDTYSQDKADFPVNQAMPKLNAYEMAAGESKYTVDLKPNDVLHASLIGSTEAYSTIVSIDASEALKMPGVVAVFTGKDVPGLNDITAENGTGGTFKEPLFADGDVGWTGQPVGIVVADTQVHADEAVAKVKVEYKSRGVPIVTLEDAILNPRYQSKWTNQKVETGNVEAAFAAEGTIIIEGGCTSGGQIHFYMEKQCAVAIPDENRLVVHTGSQQLNAYRRAVAVVTGLPPRDVTCVTRRLGGSFGGKIRRGIPQTCAVAVAAYLLDLPVKMQCSIEQDQRMTGGTEPVAAQWKIGCTKDGLITAIQVTCWMDGGAFAPGFTLTSFLEGLDQTYYVPNWKAEVYGVVSDLRPNTPLRAPGHKPGSYVGEQMIEHVATVLGMDPHKVREKNMYTTRNCVTPSGQFMHNMNLPSIWSSLKTSSNFESRLAAAKQWNDANRWVKRGISICPLKFGVHWYKTNAIVSLDPKDGGTVTISHGMVDCGQGINTRVCQAAAKILGCSIDLVRVTDTNTEVIPDQQLTGGSVATDCAVAATVQACEILNQRLAATKEKLWTQKGVKPEWATLLKYASYSDVDFCAEALFSEPGTTGSTKGVTGIYHQFSDYSYFVFSAVVTEVEVDILSGSVRVLQADMLYDAGKSVNPALDLGQCEGAYIMGLAWYLHEDVLFETTTGKLLTPGTWEYKPPLATDIPLHFNVEMLKNSAFPYGVLQSKAVGEPAKLGAYSCFSAVKMAVNASRVERNLPMLDSFNAPATIDRIHEAAAITISDLVL